MRPDSAATGAPSPSFMFCNSKGLLKASPRPTQPLPSNICTERMRKWIWKFNEATAGEIYKTKTKASPVNGKFLSDKFGLFVLQGLNAAEDLLTWLQF